MKKPGRLPFVLVAMLAVCVIIAPNLARFHSHGQEGEQKQNFPWMNTSLSPDERAELVLKEMTLDEKIDLVHGNGMPGWGKPGMPLPCTRSIFSSSVISFSTSSARSSGERLVFIHGRFCFCSSSCPCAWNRPNFGTTITLTASIAAITKVQRRGLFIFCNHPVKLNLRP